jgi:hypothetical protein
MPDAAFVDRLYARCADAIAHYHSAYPDGPPLSASSTPDLDAPPAATAAVHDAFAALTDVYDALLGVDSTPYRDTWRDHLVYDCSRRDRLRLLASNLPASLTLVAIGGRYAPSTGHIGVSPTTRSVPAAISTLASELCHAYQHRFDSLTWAHPYLVEGFERAASIRALERLVEEDVGPAPAALAQSATYQRAQALLAWGTRRGGITGEQIRELGVTDAELEAVQAAWWWRPLGRLIPRYRWSTAAFLPEYALFGSLLLVSEAAVDAPYARAFAGDHPWAERIDAVRGITPSWLWRLWYDDKYSPQG